jgi:hypothetical protein
VGEVSDTTGWQIKEVGDFNGDGKTDILWQHAPTGGMTIWFMNGATVSSMAFVGEVSDTTGWQIMK